MIVLIGESASGKSTVERTLCEKYGWNRIISYTTRPKREGEVDGIDYHYISKDIFLKLKNDGFFAEFTMYRDWYYGTAKEDCKSDRIIVANPHGFRQLKKIFKDDVCGIYLALEERERLIRMLRRGDDILECFRRVISDQGVFQNIEDDCDFTINCNKLTVEEIVDKIQYSTKIELENSIGQT